MPRALIDRYPRSNHAKTWPALASLVVAIPLMSSPALADDELLARTGASPTPKPTVATPATETREPDPNRFRWVPPDFDDDRFVARGQATYTWQRQFAFSALYTGPQSLATHPETSYTLSFTGYFGARLWNGGELYADPEAFQATPFSGLHGLAGINNGELQKASGQELRAYGARLFLRQTFNLGGECGESCDVKPGFNQVRTTYEPRRLVFSLGKFPLTDFFERSSYANDPRTQFLNWSLMTYGAYDFAADSRGYNIGGIGELYWDDWAFRAGRGMEPIIANGRSLHYNLFTRYGDQVEIEHDHKIGELPGAVRVLVYHNLALAGEYSEAVAVAAATGTTPDITSVRGMHSKIGYGLSVEQAVSGSVGLWARGMWCGCNVEQYAFTEIDNSVSAGVQVKGNPWHRSNDKLGLAFSLNGLSPQHRAYLAAGGMGGFLGDGTLNYGKEQNYEFYYSALVWYGVHLTLDYQEVVSPGYNKDRRGPVSIVGGRVHIEF